MSGLNTSVNGGLDALLTEASQFHSFADLGRILAKCAEVLGADGCIVWEVEPGPDGAERDLFVLAQHFRDTAEPVHYLEMTSRTGEAIRGNKTVNVPSVAALLGQGGIRVEEFLVRRNIQTFCSTPISLRSIGVPDAAMNLYRRRPEPFSDQEIGQLERMAAHIPFLYKSLVNQVGSELMQEVAYMFHHVGPPERRDSSNHPRALLDVINSRVAETFNSFECSIYLEDPVLYPNEYRLMASRWPWKTGKANPVYRKRQGLLGFVAAFGKPVRIFDLSRYQEDIKFIRKEYPGIDWTDPIGIREAARAAFDVPHADLPPLSFMGAPIKHGEAVLGAIKCCVARTGPYFFDDNQVRFLSHVADQIGAWWGERAEISRWTTLVQGVSELNRTVHAELNRADPSEEKILKGTMAVAAKINPAGSLVSVRWIDEQTKELYYAATQGTAWQRGSPVEAAARLNKRFPLEGPEARSAGAEVVRSGKVLEVDTTKGPYQSAAFPSDVTRIILAPISSGSKIYGVLDQSAAERQHFPTHAPLFSELLGRQLGLYHFLALKIRELTGAQADLKIAVDTQHKMFEDLQHQMKTPVISAHQMVKELLRVGNLRPSVREDVEALRGICRKAEQVVRNINLFTALATGEAIPLRPSVLVHDDLIRRLKDASRDHTLTLNRARRLSFFVDELTFDPVWTITVLLDHDLLDQAINNLFDNACKYSYDSTRVLIRGNLLQRERFSISVLNQGFPVTAAEKKRLIERGYRSDQAQWSTGEGSGIGLWIVDRIMSAHGGSLEIIPTNAQGITEFRLVFPITKTKATQ